MKISVIGSSSDGNTIICQSDDDVFILDAGMNIKDVMIALDHDISNIKFVAVTHKDSDHAKYIKEYLKLGISVYMPPQVKEKYKSSYNALALEPLKNEKCGRYKIIPFEVPHGEDVTWWMRHTVRMTYRGRVSIMLWSSAITLIIWLIVMLRIMFTLWRTI